MGARQPADAGAGERLLALYDEALPHVYGYLVRRCGSDTVAEDLTAEVFLAAVTAVRQDTVPDLTVAWLVGVARHKLVDHWRRAGRESRALRVVRAPEPPTDDEWIEVLDAGLAGAALAALGPHHRAALTLRHVDGLAVPVVAEHLGRTVHATESLLSRARVAFRRAYGERREGTDHGH